jgi:hypothetical protein
MNEPLTLLSGNAASEQSNERENLLHLARRCWPGYSIDLDPEAGGDAYDCSFAVELCHGRVALADSQESAETVALGRCCHIPLCHRQHHNILPAELWVQNARRTRYEP